MQVESGGEPGTLVARAEAGGRAAHIFSNTMPLQWDEPPKGLHLN